jgi:hypothetical protein
MYAVLITLMAGSLAFHYAYCLVPSLRYFRARRAAYVLGAVAYLIVAVPPALDLLGSTDNARNPAYYVAAAAMLSVATLRPFAFVRATGGSRPAESN